MNSRKNNVEMIEQTPIAELTVGRVEQIPIEITFKSEGLDYRTFTEICSLLEERGYNSSKLRITEKSVNTRAVGHRREGRFIYEGNKKDITYSLKYDGLDSKTMIEIEKLLEHA